MGRDPYRSAHKAMRVDMFEVSRAIAVTDFNDPDDVARLRARFAGLVGAMEHHATIEAEHIHPLAREVAPEVVAELDAEHVELDAALADLQAELASLPVGDDAWARAHAFYLGFNRYVARYLEHIDREEREVTPRLAALDQDRLAAAAYRDYAGPVEMLVAAMATMMPLFNVEDRRAIVADIRAVRSPEDFARVAEAGALALGNDGWARLME